jgi:hypothetical protein
MNVWRLYGAMVFLNATISLSGMELTEHEQALQPIDIKIRNYFFGEDKIAYYFKRDTLYTTSPNNLEGFLNSFSHVIRASPNIANSCDLSRGVSCIIKSGEDLIAANTQYKHIRIGSRGYYKICKQDASPICSLAYTPQCIAAGYADGSFFVASLRINSCFIAPPCHEAPITSIVCIPSQKICVLGGGEAVRMYRPKVSNVVLKDGEVAEVDVKTICLGTNKKGNPRCADIVAVAGPFIVIKTTKNKPFIKSLYSSAAFNAIQFGTFTGPQKSVLKRMIDAQDNKLPLALSEEDHEIFGSLCPTIRYVLQH